eukprot:XP_024448168.1 uncharacterized protein LOC18095686 [Populus trichocarpa]
MGYIPILLFCFFSLLNRVTATAIDIINTTQFIRDGDTIVSADGTYELGFFSPGKSKNRYLGIWYGKLPVQTVVWVANRETPLNDSLGVLKITDKGILILLDRSGSVIWSSNTARPARNPTAQLLESGNLVVKEEGDNNLENSLWQSFEHPTDTILPGMKLGRSRITGMEWSMTSWKSEDDPSRGNITCKLAPYGYPDIVVMEGSQVKYRSGLWDGLRFSGVPSTKPNPIYKYEFVFNEKEIFYRESLVDKSMHWRLVTRQNGDIASFTWIEKTQSWLLYETANTDNCDRYALCGANGFCDIQSSPMCDCLNGFVPKSPRDWNVTDWANGCVRRTPLNCSGDGFRKLAGVKMPETKSSWFSKTMNLEECRNTCLEKCNCTAYSNLDIRNGGSGCLLWFGDLVDIRVFAENEQEIYIRMAESEPDIGDGARIKKKSEAKKRIIISTVLSTGILFLGLALVLYAWMKKHQKNIILPAGQMTEALERSSNNMQRKEDLELPLFDFSTLACATNNFSTDNKLGEGGFGTVYKGTLADGREIAVKRLSKISRQGLDELENEANYIMKLQHRNLVKLLGCCIERDEKMLIYEFLPNKSLDFFIFEKTRSFLLDWPKRYNIINGIARGLLYLHQDSRLRVIHRDLKAGNILLDNELNPKISDFGLARSFGGNKIEANTNKVAGTYGYISPEYANYGLYSVKSDIFSFGVLVLEIVSGNKNRGFSHPDHHLNLLGHAWILFKENRSLELAADSIAITCNLSEVLRSIHVGLLCVQENPEIRPLCVQENPEMRPTMSNVVLMLGNDDVLPQPKQPGIFSHLSHSLTELQKKTIEVTMGYIPILLFCFFSLLNRVTATAIDIINTAQFIRDGDTIVSADGTYELGFFSPGKSKNRYLGIWYGKIPVQTVVWVANRETPLNDSLGVLKITHKGILILLDRSGSVIWSSNTARPARNPTAQLLESGNLVVKEEGDNNLENSLWQSFEHPTDTILPGMKLGRSRITGMDWSMTSWKSEDDPSRGNITCKLAPYGYPDMVVMEGSQVKYRSGLWDGLRFSGVPSTKPNPIYKYEFVFNEKEIFYRESLVDKSMHWRLVTRQNGDVASFTWIEKKQSWLLYETANTDNCDRYAICGANGFCDIQSSPVCDCLNGFVPKSPRDWNVTDWANGCVRRTPLNCSGDGFRKLAGVKMPETKSSWFSKTMNLEECRNTCLEKCNCTAYSNLDIRNEGSGCLLWFGDLVDIRVLDDNEQEIYIRMAESELVVDNGDGAKINKKSKAKKRIIISTVLSTGILFLGLALVLSVWMKKQQKNRKIADALERSPDHMHKEDLELPMFDLGTLACATNNFSVENKLGEGGFGSVYKGTLEDRREIAVKRLSKNSRQGLDEFKNEANYIVKLQHQNLVKLLGCCIQGDEKILIYEFLPNRSLDIFIFENTHSFLLDWPKRCNIIFGIARGLLYLHQDSRLRVIHRDLKASNILLDDELNPKISDFGLARSFGGNETEANTNTVAGTYGYISPEYANHGLYSLKSDVFSFGVLVLEIVSGNRNRGFIHPDHSLNLLGHAWRLFEENRPLELVEESLVIACNLSEVLRSIHVGLLCVQENPEDRPNMSNVVLMLRDDGTLPQPKQPGFFTERDLTEARYSSSLSKPCSVNECSISELRPR